mmetsp:Transcript_90966/g.253167  ORF Transcript_90966/g.253167 Transcript_90966/m.253167 type:complete len:158 (-) Transcript_90966:112-585(-)
MATARPALCLALCLLSAFGTVSALRRSADGQAWPSLQSSYLSGDRSVCWETPVYLMGALSKTFKESPITDFALKDSGSKTRCAERGFVKLIETIDPLCMQEVSLWKRDTRRPQYKHRAGKKRAEALRAGVELMQKKVFEHCYQKVIDTSEGKPSVLR